MITIRYLVHLACALPLATLLAQPVGAAESQGTGEEGGSLIDQVTVTGARLQKAVSDVTTSISVLDEIALAEQFSMSTDLFDALNATVPGLNVNQGNHQGCGTNIRGRAASFQVNGIPVNQDLRESNCNAMYQVSPFALERIEVVRGATALYGAGAPGGIVNLITRRAASAEIEIDSVALLSANPEGTSDSREYNFYVGAGQSFDRWDYYGGIAHSDVNAARTPRGTYVPREEYDSWSAHTSVGFRVGESGEFRMTGTFYREERGREYAADGSQNASTGTFAPVVVIENNPFKDQGKDQLYTLALGYTQSGFLGHEFSVSGYVQNQEYLQRANFWDGTFGNFFFDTDAENERQGLRSTLARAFELGSTTLELEYGVDWVRNRFYRPQVDPATGEVLGFTSPETILNTTSGFAQADLVLGRLRLSGGTRYERYRGEVGSDGYDPSLPGAGTPGDLGNSNLWLYNLGAVLDLSDRMQLYGGFSQGAELTQLGRAARGVSDPSLLTPEPATSDQYEIGLRGDIGPTQMSLALFYSESDKAAALQADPSCAGQPFCPFIPLRAPQRFKGAEATFDWRVSSSVDLGGVVTYQRGEQFLPELGRYVDYSTDAISPPRITVYVAFEPTQGWSNRLQGTYFDSTDYFAPYDFGPPTTVRTESLFLADFTSSYELGRGELTLSISNLFDKEYVNVAAQASGNFFYFMEEGRRVSIGYRLRM